MAGASPVQTQEDIVPPAPTPVGFRLTGVLMAPAVAVVVLVILTGPFGLDVRKPDVPGSATLEELDLLTTTLVTLALGLLGWVLAVLLERGLGASRGRRIWLLVAVAVLLVSLLAILPLDISSGARWGLVVLHTAVAMVLIPAMSARGQP